MRGEIPVVAIRKSDPDIALKVLFVDGPAALELDLSKVCRTAAAVLTAQNEVYPVIVEWQKRIVPAFHGKRDQSLAIDHFNHLARGLV